jgi:hypothetical protein
VTLASERGQHEQLCDHASHAFGFYSHAPQGTDLELWVRCSYLFNQIEGGEHDRQGRAKFVRHVDQKVPGGR